MTDCLEPKHMKLYDTAKNANIDLAYAEFNARNIGIAKYVSYASAFVTSAVMGYVSSKPGFESLSMIAIGGSTLFLGFGVYGSLVQPGRKEKLSEARKSNDELKSSTEFKELESIVAGFKKEDAWPAEMNDRWNPFTS